MFRVRQAENPPQNRFLVQVAYGTSVLKTNRRITDFFVANWSDRLLCRLPQATRFDLDTVVWLPWAKPYFVARKTSDDFDTPVISVLPQNLQIDLAWLMAEREKQGMNDHFKAPC